MFIYAYNYGSKAAKVLSHALGAPRIKHARSRFRGHPRKKVINWGAGRLPNEVWECNVFNRHVQGDKLEAFKRMRDVETVPWTTDPDVANTWIEDGHTVVARTLLRAHSGRGIVLCDDESGLVPAPLYTRYVKKHDEYRVHVVRNRYETMTMVSRKARDLDNPTPNWKIRNHANGFVFINNVPEGEYPAPIINVAKQAVYAMGYDFGAVDILWNKKKETAFVCEVNAAPGIEASTVEFYADALSYL